MTSPIKLNPLWFCHCCQSTCRSARADANPARCHRRGCQSHDVSMVDEGNWPEGKPLPPPTERELKERGFEIATATTRFRGEQLSWLGPAQEWHCIYCHQQGDYEHGPDGRAWHIDHIYPLVLGGDWERDNLVLACATCNLGKNRKLLMTWLRDSLLSDRQRKVIRIKAAL